MFWKKPPPPYVSAVVAAAGVSSRMEGVDKQRTALGQLPVVVRSVEALSRCGLITEIVLVCPSTQIPHYYAIVRDYGLGLVSSVVGGGATRQESVFAGIASCNGQADYFAIHDGARPLVTPGLAEECILAAIRHGAAAPGVIPKDTIKRADASGAIVQTFPRDELIAIQTPQVFEAGLYREAMELALREGRCYSDDCQLVERTGNKVYVVPGRYDNIKITTPEDMAVAGAVLRFREEGPNPWEQDLLE